MANAPFFTTKHSEATGGSFDPLPIGEYEVICSEAKVDKSSSGNQMIKLTLTVRSDVPQEGQNRKFFHNIVFTEKTGGIIQGVLKAFGVEDGKSFKDPADMAKNAFLYKPVRLKNKHENDTRAGHEGEVQDRVAFFKPTEVSKSPVSGQSDPFAGSPASTISDLPF